MKYNVGDKVIIKGYRTEGSPGWNREGQMDKYLGKTMTIRKLEKNGYRMLEDSKEGLYGDGWYWADHMIEGLEVFDIQNFLVVK